VLSQRAGAASWLSTSAARDVLGAEAADAVTVAARTARLHL